MKRFLVNGRVQGVGFRLSTKKKAVKLGLVGWVRNVPDGSVEILAGGALPALISFEDWLWEGSKTFNVTKVVTVSFDEELIFSDFRIV